MRTLTPYEHGLRDGKRQAQSNLRVPMHTTEQIQEYWRGYQEGRRSRENDRPALDASQISLQAP